MKPSRSRDVVLTAIGWTALILYILACRPSWSPDGNKVLFSYYDREQNEAGVGLFDRRSGETRSVFVRPGAPSDDAIPVEWSADGERALLWIENREILLFPIDSTKPAQTLELPKEAAWNGAPTPYVDGNLYFGGDAVVKVDLATGDVTKMEVDGDPVLIQSGNHISYVAQSYDVVHDGDEATYKYKGYEYGRVDIDELTLQPLFRIQQEELESHGIDELGFPALAPDGVRVAMMGVSTDDRAKIVLCDDKGVSQIFIPELSDESYVLGNFEWSRTEEILYAGVMIPTFGKDESQFFVAEIALDGTPPRLTPLGRIEKSVSDDDYWLLTLALAPDGSRIAVSTAHNDDDAFPESDHGLFIVELEEPERSVTKIPLTSWKR